MAIDVVTLHGRGALMPDTSGVHRSRGTPCDVQGLSLQVWKDAQSSHKQRPSSSKSFPHILYAPMWQRCDSHISLLDHLPELIQHIYVLLLHLQHKGSQGGLENDVQFISPILKHQKTFSHHWPPPPLGLPKHLHYGRLAGRCDCQAHFSDYAKET